MKLLRFTFGTWLVVVVVRFCITLVRSVANPLNTGWDWMWCRAWIFFCAVLLILVATSGKRLLLGRDPQFVWSIWLMPLLPAIAIVYLSGNVGAALAALWLFLLSAAVGGFILRKLIGRNEATIDYL